MELKRIIRALLIGIVCVCPIFAHAQITRQIQGKVSLSDDAIYDVAIGGSYTCFVYSCYNKEQADNILNDFKSNPRGVPAKLYQNRKQVQLTGDTPEVEFKIEAVNDGFIMTLIDKSGYEISPVMRKVGKNMSPPVFTVNKIKAIVQKADKESTLQEIDVVGKIIRGATVSSRTVEEDGMLLLRIADLPHPCRIRSNSRIIVQPYWLDGPDMGENKVFAYASPVVYDYNEYDFTQTRRMGFDKEKNDKLARFFINDTTQTRIEVKDDTLHLRNYVDTLSGHNPDESYPYPARAIIAVEDYNERYVLHTEKIDEGERTNYIKFLDFSYEKDLDVNPNDFKEQLETKPMNSNGEVKLNFEVGKAYLNPKDTMNNRILENARNDLKKAFSQKSSKLLFMQVYGYSSPEGNPQSNLNLARRRADFALSEIKTAIPYHMHKDIHPSESEILGWNVVADSLQRDGLNEEAQQLRDIVAKYPNNLVSQGLAIQRLPYYASVIKPIYLPKLRTVKYAYVKVEDRSLTPEELIQYFDQGRDETEFVRAHYYHLIQHYWDKRKEPATRQRLEQIAKRALENTRMAKDDIGESDSLFNEGYWALAANLLATSYIERDTFDLDILRPFINRAIVTDSAGNKRYAEGLSKKAYFDNGNIAKYTNFPQFIAEQMIMLLMQPGRKNMDELGQLTDMIESDPDIKNDSTYSNLLALANCKRGYYRAGKNCTPERAREVRAVVSDISITNSAIMNIAVADSGEGDEARTARDKLLELIYELPETAIGYYLRAIIELLREVPNTEQAARYLAQSFKMDIHKMPVANNDQQLIHNRKKIIIPAFAEWEDLMKKEVYTRTFDKESFDALGYDSLYIVELRKQGTLNDILSSCWIETTNDKHPYYWYEKAINARTTATDSVLIGYLSQCVSLDSNYLDVIYVARTADSEVSGKGNEKLQKLFEDFYLNELRRRRD